MYGHIHGYAAQLTSQLASNTNTRQQQLPTEFGFSFPLSLDWCVFCTASGNNDVAQSTLMLPVIGPISYQVDKNFTCNIIWSVVLLVANKAVCLWHASSDCLYRSQIRHSFYKGNALYSLQP